MEARSLRAALVVLALLSVGATHRTRNFIVTAPTPQLAREIGEKAESDRQRLALEWLGAELPPWPQPCPITAHVGNFGAGGATSFMFDHGRPFGWTMTIQGTRQRILDSVLPHEITHTIFATHFGRPLPRWADEGACTTIEHASERRKQDWMLINFLTTNRGIAFNRMFAMQQYPHDVLPLYAQGYSLARFLIAQGGKQKFVRYIGDGMKSGDWSAATKRHYGYADLSDLQVTWLDWVRRGCPPISEPEAGGQPEAIAEQQTDPPDNQVAAADRSDQTREAPAPLPASGHAVPIVPAERAPAPQVAQVTEIRSWYLEQRDLAMARRCRTAPCNEDAARLLEGPSSYAPGSIKGALTGAPNPGWDLPAAGPPNKRATEKDHRLPAASRVSVEASAEPPGEPAVPYYYDASVRAEGTVLR